MSQYYYKAIETAGGHVTGTIEAADRRNAIAVLADKGHLVTELVEEAQAKKAKPVTEAQHPASTLSKVIRLGSRRITSKDILAMTTQLSTALQAGLPLFNGLELIHEQQHKIGMKEMLGDVAHSVSSGQSLSEAMAAHGQTFSSLYLSMIRVGETGGILEQTTSQLASILSREEKIKTNMKNASAYPLFVLSIGLISVAVILTWILPNILATIGTSVAAMPLPTRILMAASGFLKALFTSVYGWAALVLLAVGLYYARRWTKSDGRLQWDSFKLRVPILGSVLRSIAVGRFARTLGALTKGGVTILEALGVVRDTLGNEMLGRDIDTVADKVRRGESLAEPLRETRHFPPLLVQIVSIGEQTGRLDELLLNAAETFDTEADSAITRFMSVFPAVLILMLALLIGFIIAATLLPIVVMELSAGAF